MTVNLYGAAPSHQRALTFTRPSDDVRGVGRSVFFQVKMLPIEYSPAGIVRIPQELAWRCDPV